tara:strand:+ start:1322 stop:3538 length:2217 start_codon:yes stop_codon:yes gene_type:complete
MSIPEVFYRETIDLNRFSNSVAKKYAVTYNEIILKAAKQLRDIDIRQRKAGEAVVIAPQTRKRLRAIIKQAKNSLNTWSSATARDFKKELQGITVLQRDFIVKELKKVTASGDVPINSVAVSPKYADSFINTDPTQTNIFTSKEFTEDDFVKFGSGKFELTARQGAAVTLPNGQTVEKAFRGIATSSQQKLALAIRSGVFSGETTQQIARRLVGRLDFNQPGSVKQIAAAGGEVTKLANHQVQTIVRTSINQAQNQASQAVYAANSKVAPKYEYVATLDSRTSSICQRLDGQKFSYNKGPIPPQHFNCRSTTVPVVDFDGLQKKYPSLEKPPATALDTRPSITGRVPQNVAYGDWLLNQDRKLQVKTLGNEGKVNYFKKLAKKEGSGQAALRKMIRTDGSERSLKDLERLYGKPSAIKPKVKPEVATSQIKTSPVMGTNGVDKYLVDNNIAKTSQEFIEDSLDSLEKLGGLTKTNVKKMRKFMKKTKLINHFNMKGEKTDLKQIKEKFLTGNNLKAFKEQLKATEKRFAIQQAKPKMSKEFKEWTSPLLGGIRTQFQILNKGKGPAFDRYMVSQHFKNAGGLNLGFTNTNYSIVHAQLTTQSKKINLNLAKKMKASATKTLDNNALLHNRGYDFARQNNLKEIWGTSQPMSADMQWFSTFIHETGHQVHFQSGANTLGRQFQKLKGMTFTSEYSRKNTFEQFAEGFTMYILNPEGLQKNAPRLYNWIDEAIDLAIKEA